jgi:hypothetical protein
MTRAGALPAKADEETRRIRKRLSCARMRGVNQKEHEIREGAPVFLRLWSLVESGIGQAASSIRVEVTSHRPSGLNSTYAARLEGLAMPPARRPSSRLQGRTLALLPAAATRVLSGLTEGDLIDIASLTLESEGEPPRCGVPHPRDAAGAGPGNVSTVGTEVGRIPPPPTVPAPGILKRVSETVIGRSSGGSRLSGVASGQWSVVSQAEDGRSFRDRPKSGESPPFPGLHSEAPFGGYAVTEVPYGEDLNCAEISALCQPKCRVEKRPSGMIPISPHPRAP